jgi:CHAD domain-containing protein
MRLSRIARRRRQSLLTWARTVVRRRLRVLEQELVRLERQPDAEAIHDTRVAGRRLRAALRHLEGCFPPLGATHLRADIAGVARRLGAIRDLDILLENLAPEARRKHSPLALLVERMALRRQRMLRAALPVARTLRLRLPSWRPRLGLGS